MLAADDANDDKPFFILGFGWDFNPFAVFPEKLAFDEINAVLCLVRSAFRFIIFEFHIGIENIPFRLTVKPDFFSSFEVERSV